MSFAPIIVFAFNRADTLRNTITSLKTNEEAKASDLFVFVDGARAGKAGEKEKVDAVQEYVKSIDGFKETSYRFSNENRGLGNSIIAGVSEIINRYGRAIVLEDDLVLSRNFLSFMNKGLDLYEKYPEVFSVCGYTNKVKTPRDYAADAYFCTRSSSWGWGTWADRWNSVDWKLEDWDGYKKESSRFNRWGGSDCWKMLNNWHDGRNKSWAIRFCFAQFLQNKLSVFPTISKVKNDGFDGQGTNCKRYSRFKCDFDETERKDFKLPLQIEMNKALWRSAISYNSVIKRLWSKIMYMIYR